MAFRLGIDLGTSTTVAVLGGPASTRPLLFDASPLLSSAVFAGAGPELLTGLDAERAATARPAGLEANPKRRIDDGTIWLGERDYPVAEILAAILRRVGAEARRVAGEAPAEVVLTHPAAWGRTRLSLLADAAARAGMPDAGLVPEPVAAAAYFATVRGLGPEQCVVVYDLGAGTFDVSVVRRAPGGAGFEVVAADGLTDVGGLDLDAAVVQHARSLTVGAAAAAAAAWGRLDWPQTHPDQQARRALWLGARATKEQLTRHATADLHLPLVETAVHLTREEFERAARPYLDRTTALTVKVLRDAGAGPERIGGVFLVGGSSRIPLAATLLHRTLRIAPTVVDQPELVVAEGSLLAPVTRAAAAPRTADLRTLADPPEAVRIGGLALPAPTPADPADLLWPTPPVSAPPATLVSAPPATLVSAPPTRPVSAPPARPVSGPSGPPVSAPSAAPTSVLPASVSPVSSAAPVVARAAVPVAAATPRVEPAPPPATRVDLGQPSATGVDLGQPSATGVDLGQPPATRVEPAQPPVTRLESGRPSVTRVEPARPSATAPSRPAEVPPGGPPVRRRGRGRLIGTVVVVVLLLAAGGVGAKLWLGGRGPVLAELRGHTGPVRAVAFSPDGKRLATVGDDKTIRFWDVARRKEAGAALSTPTELRAVAFSPDGKLLAAAGQDQQVRVWDIATRAPHDPQPAGGRSFAVTGLAFDKNSTALAAAGDGGIALIYDLAGGQQLAELDAMNDGFLSAVAFSPRDADRLVLGGSHEAIGLYSTNARGTGLPVESASRHAGAVRAVAFSPDGAMVASAGTDGEVLLWPLDQAGIAASKLSGHAGAVNGVAFDRTGRTVVSVGDDKTVRRWDVASRSQLGAPYDECESAVNAVAYSPSDGKIFATGSSDGVVRLWRVN